MTKRASKVHRKTSETDVQVSLQLDGTGESAVKTGIPFMDHMLSLFAKHGLFDLEIEATGDLEVDDHHLVEDLGICLGQAVKESVGGKEGISRYGHAIVLMDEALAEARDRDRRQPERHLDLRWQVDRLSERRRRGRE